MKCNGPSGNIVHLQKGEVLIVKNPVAACTSTVNPETCHVHHQHCMKCNGLSGKFVHIQQGKVQIVINPIAACTSTVQP